MKLNKKIYKIFKNMYMFVLAIAFNVKMEMYKRIKTQFIIKKIKIGSK
jgi:hypothetical protein